MNRKKGFTLLELMIVVAIVAVLAALAYPSYNRYVERTRRAEGRELLMRVSAAQERFYTNRNQYAANFGDLGMTNGDSENGYYTVAITLGAGNQSYTLTATPGGPQATDACAELTINNTGFKAAPSNTGSNGACW